MRRVCHFSVRLIFLIVLGRAVQSAAAQLYVSDFADGTIRQVTANGVVSTFVSGLADPVGLAFDHQGDLFVTDEDVVHGPGGSITITPQVVKITPAGTISLFAQRGGEGLAFDDAGNLYVADNLQGIIYRITPDGAFHVFAQESPLSAPYGLVFDRAGNLYVANEGTDTISKISPAGTLSTFVDNARGLLNPRGLVFDTQGNLLVANYFGGISEVAPDGSVRTFTSAVRFPGGLALDASGALFVTSQIQDLVYRVTPTGSVDVFARGFDQPVNLAFAPTA